MKKWLCMLLALLLALATGALAEAEPDADVIERFEDVWVGDDFAVEIWYDGGFHCSAVLSGEDDAGDVWEFGGCAYDAEQDALICEDGTRYAQAFDEAGELQSTVAGENLTAVLAFDENGSLVFDDSEGICGGWALQRLFDAEEQEYWKAAEVFIGSWQCGRCNVEISPEEDDLKVLIYWGNSATEVVEWVYTCQFDEAENTLTSFGEASKTLVTFGEDGELVSAEEAYRDGAAVFRFDGNGCMVWEDAKENAGDGLTFERSDMEEYGDTGAFEGRWGAGRCSIEISPEDDGYRVFVQWGNSAADSIEWEYTCLYDEELDGLVSVGEATKADVFYDENGEISDTELFYSDGVATFTLDENDGLHWNDEIENAGEDLVFERAMEFD